MCPGTLTIVFAVFNYHRKYIKNLRIQRPYPILPYTFNLQGLTHCPMGFWHLYSINRDASSPCIRSHYVTLAGLA